jgi:hypothetical protein
MPSARLIGWILRSAQGFPFNEAGVCKMLTYGADHLSVDLFPAG